MIRVYSGLSRKDFGRLFNSEESTVYQWEYGRSIPRLSKLIAISSYFDISLDVILSGRISKDGNMLEKRIASVDMSEGPVADDFRYTARFMAQFNALSSYGKERLIGYLDALCRENDEKTTLGG